MNSSLGDSVAFCRGLARRTGRNFYYSFLTLPPDLHADMCVLYSFMRLSDDLGDDGDVDVATRTARLDDWRDWLHAALDQGEFHHPVFPALADLLQRRRIPREYLLALLDGITMDLGPVRFETFNELERYCYHVAGVVGLCCIHVWGFHGDEAVSRAVDCGTAFQLTNILRDLREDAESGRVYLPAADWERFGCSPDRLMPDDLDAGFADFVRFQATRAREYYARGHELLSNLSPDGVPILSSMLRIYGGILDRIERSPLEVADSRIGLPGWRKLMIAADEIIRRRWRGGADHAESNTMTSGLK